MAVSGANASNPFMDFMNWARSGGKSQDEIVKDSAKILGDEMNRLYPTGGGNWSNVNLQKIVDTGEIMDETGQKHTVTPEVKAAAKAVLDAGGMNVIGNKDDKTTASELLEIK